MRMFGSRRASLCSFWSTIASLVLFSIGSAGCAPPDEEGEEEGSATAALAATPQRSICFGGRTFGDPRSNGGIPEIESLCNRLPGLVRDVPGGTDGDFPFFQWDTGIPYVLNRLVDVLDTNKDGNVTNIDAPAELNVVGFSWGGFNAKELVAAIAADGRFSPSRKIVTRYFALDAYRTDYLVFSRTSLSVPGNVKSFWSFRHSKEPDDECSRIMFGMIGPFMGRVPRCTGTTTCKDYDYSAAAATAWVDHCAVPKVADDAVLDLIAGRTPRGLPPERAVTRY
jgi:hypothetical protein